jgi:hypothetical protein
MAKRKPRKRMTAEENAERDRFMERVRARIAEREATDERERRAKERRASP